METEGQTNYVRREQSGIFYAQFDNKIPVPHQQVIRYALEAYGFLLNAPEERLTLPEFAARITVFYDPMQPVTAEVCRVLALYPPHGPQPEQAGTLMGGRRYTRTHKTDRQGLISAEDARAVIARAEGRPQAPTTQDLFEILKQLFELRGQVNYDSVIWSEVDAIIQKMEGRKA